MPRIAVLLLFSLFFASTHEDRKRSTCGPGLCTPEKTVFCGVGGNIPCVDGGKVSRVDAEAIEITNFSGTAVVYRHDECTQVFKGKTFFSFSTLHPGEVVYVHFHCNPNGERVVEELWVNDDRTTERK